MSKLLFDKPPLVVDPDLAAAIGLKEAIILQQIHYWLQINKEANRNFHDGLYWTFNSAENWRKQFPFLSVKQIRSAFANLENQNLISVRQYNKSSFDQTKWYTINYFAVNKLVSEKIVSVPYNEVPSEGHGCIPFVQMQNHAGFKGFESGFREKIIGFGEPEEMTHRRPKKLKSQSQPNASESTGITEK